MEYHERQMEVGRIEAALAQSSTLTPDMLRQHAAGKPEDLRRDIYAMYWRMGTAAQDPARRAAIAEFMLQQVREETPMLRGQLLKWLQDFRREDFDPEARRVLLELTWAAPYGAEVIRLLGIAEIPEAFPKLQAQVRNEPLPPNSPVGYQGGNTWAALLALARMGDPASLALVIEQVRRTQDIVLRASVLLLDLGYTRRPEAFNLLRVYLNSNERLPAVKATAPGRLEAAYAAAVFSKYVLGFPIDETDFNDQQVSQARAWANAQTSWRFK
jgi:hypothetical protein